MVLGCMQQMYAILEGIKTFEKDGITISLFKDAHIDSQTNPVVPIEHTQFLVQAKKYNAGVVAEDATFYEGKDQVIIRSIQRTLTKNKKHIEPLYKININGHTNDYDNAIEDSFLDCLVAGCKKQGIAAYSSECRHALIASKAGYAISCKEVWAFLTEETKKIIDFSTDAQDKEEQELGEYYNDQVSVFLASSKRFRLADLNGKTFKYLIQKVKDDQKNSTENKADFLQFEKDIFLLECHLGSELVDAHIMHQIQLLKQQHKHIFVAAGANHCDRVAQQLITMGYKEVLSACSLIKEEQVVGKEHQYNLEYDLIDMAAYFKKLDGILAQGDGNQANYAKDSKVQAAAAAPQERKEK